MSESSIKVVIVDDSRVVQQLLNEIFTQAPGIEVVGIAGDPLEARDMIKALNPDVITLDVEMPKMDGITFLGNLMRLRPMPVVMISTLTEKGGDITLEALELGAIDYIAKPKVDLEGSLKELSGDIVRKVKAAARANIKTIEHNSHQLQLKAKPSAQAGKYLRENIQLVAIGASTGGTEAIKEVLVNLPEHMPPIVIVQHMPAGFTGSFARRLDSLCQLKVVELTEPREALHNNHVYIAHGAYHMVIEHSRGKLFGLLNDAAPVNRHKPAVDMLFASVAEQVGENSIGVILTGMGVDGARGLAQMHRAGATTVAQDEKSSVVWGMPRVAIEEGAAGDILPLAKIGRFLTDQCYH